MRSYFKRTMNLEGLTKISTGCFELNMLWGQAFRGQPRSWEYSNPKLCQWCCLSQAARPCRAGGNVLSRSIYWKATLSSKIRLHAEEIIISEGTPVVILMLKLSSKGSCYDIKCDILLRPDFSRGQIQDIVSAEGPLPQAPAALAGLRWIPTREDLAQCWYQIGDLGRRKKFFFFCKNITSK